MAEFMNQSIPVDESPGTDGFAAMGKPVPNHRKTAALAHCRAMGLTDTIRAMTCISQMAFKLERDQPSEAMAIGMRHLDLIGTYRLMAVLLTARKPVPGLDLIAEEER